jgi:hypothetical protein
MFFASCQTTTPIDWRNTRYTHHREVQSLLATVKTSFRVIILDVQQRHALADGERRR